MIKLIYSPRWFYGKDIIIDIFSVVVLLLIAVFSLKYYVINKKKKNYFWFSISFIILAIAFLFKILTNFTVYYHVINTKDLGYFTFTYQTIKTSQILFSMGFLGYMFLSLIGFFILYILYHKNKKQDFLLLFYFIIIITYFSVSKYFVFHLTSLILLFFITLKYFKNYSRNRSKNSKYLFLSFCLIAFSQLIFIFVDLHNLFYVLAEFIQLFGYFMLLITFVRILKNGKKK